MSELLKRLWHDPVWSKVIASGIVAVTGGGVVWFGWWTDRLSAWGAVAISLLTETTVPNWIVLGLAVAAVPTLLGLRRVLRAEAVVQTKSTKPAQSHPWLPYRSDIYRGLKWRWDYTKGGVVTNLRSYCLHCDYRVLPHGTSAYGVARVRFTCEDCDRSLGEFNGGMDDLESLVIRWIEKRIRNNLWQAGKDSRSPGMPNEF